MMFLIYRENVIDLPEYLVFGKHEVLRVSLAPHATVRMTRMRFLVIAPGTEYS
jgi:hypothetical protein